jgi:hypothetical protein
MAHVVHAIASVTARTYNGSQWTVAQQRFDLQKNVASAEFHNLFSSRTRASSRSQRVRGSTIRYRLLETAANGIKAVANSIKVGAFFLALLPDFAG